MRVLAQAPLHQNDVVQGRDNGEEKRSPQKLDARDPYPAQRTNLKEKDKKNWKSNFINIPHPNPLPDGRGEIFPTLNSHIHTLLSTLSTFCT